MKIYFSCNEDIKNQIQNIAEQTKNGEIYNTEYTGDLRSLIKHLSPKENYKNFISSYNRIVISYCKFLYLRLYHWKDIEDKLVVVERCNDVILGIKEDHYTVILRIIDKIYEVTPEDAKSMKNTVQNIIRVGNSYYGSEEMLLEMFCTRSKGTILAEYSEITGEFVCGRKCGKMRRILKVCGGEFSSQKTENKNIMIKIKTDDIQMCIKGLEMEYPVKQRFYLNERYHKKIIGVKGMNIQAIMKKYNVYVRFHSGNLEGGNVEIIAPFKNSRFFENVRREIFDQCESYQTIFPGISSLFSLSKSKKTQ